MIGQSTLKTLQGIEILRGVSETDLAELARGAKSRTYALGECIVWAGEAAGCTFIIASGSARVYRIADNGKVATLYIARPGDIIPVISERSFMDALEDGTHVCRLPRQLIQRLQSRHPHVALRLEELLVERLMRAYDLVEELICLDTLERVRMLLGRLAGAKGGTVSITREELASMVGATRQQVTVCLNALRDKGVIDYQTHRRREILVLPQLQRTEVTTNF